MKTVFVYVTTTSPEEARKLGHLAVENRLAACVNILPPAESIYRWEDKIQTERETVFIAKTTEERFGALKELILANHRYTNPCVVALPVEQGAESFLQWVRSETTLTRTPGP
jgi:periplasmic divalent cation tolerance protein